MDTLTLGKGTVLALKLDLLKFRAEVLDRWFWLRDNNCLVFITFVVIMSNMLMRFPVLFCVGLGIYIGFVLS